MRAGSLFLFCVILFSLPGSAQKEANIWYFGIEAGVDFNESPPVALTNGKMITGEGCASIANRNGRLLFYTDGTTIYNKAHSIMTNGTGLTGDGSSTQSAIIVQNPDSGHIYYVFTTFQKLAYSVVDTTLSGGMGAVREKNILLLSPGTEKLTGVRHANGRDVWVVSHRDMSNSYYVYLVTGAGVNAIPVVSNAGPNVYGGSLGAIKLSPDGKTMVFTDYDLSSNSVQLLDFDISTGKISNARTLASERSYYGAEFSPSGRYLYVTNFEDNRLEQYDMQAGSITGIINSKYNVDVGTATGMVSALQLAPDGRIYIAHGGQQSLDVIKSPDNAGAACNYTAKGLPLGGKQSNLGLPAFNQSFFLRAKVSIKYTCHGDTTLLSLNDTTGLDSLVWHFGDTASPEKISRMLKGRHVYSHPGIFQGKLYVYRRVLPKKDSVSFEVEIKPRPDVSLGPDRTICKGAFVSLAVTNASGDPEITWSHGLGTGKSKTVSPGLTVTYRVIADAGCAAYKDTDEVTVYVRPPVKVSLPADTTICSGRPVTITAVAKGGDSSYTFTWDNGLGMGNPKTVAPLVTTTYRVIADDGCTVKKDTAYVKISVSPAAGVAMAKDTNICRGGSAVLSPVVFNAIPGYTLTWNNGLGTGSAKTVSPLVTTVYAVTLSDGCSPAVSDTQVVNVENLSEIKFAADTSLCEEEEVKFDNMSTGTAASYKYTWRFGDGKSAVAEDPAYAYQEAGLYTVMLIAESPQGCKDTLIKTGYIRVYHKPVASFTTNPPSTDVEHPEVSLTNLSSGADHYLWDFGDTSTSAETDPVHVYTRAAVFPITLIAGNDAGCYDTAIYDFRVKDIYHFYIPLSFSPNGDGANDKFMYSCKGCASVSMKIFNRWGEVVFATGKVNEYWNGGMNNILPALPEGVYAYVLDIRDSNKATHHYKGMVTVVK